jgi:multidrug resistance efflux pump
MIKINSLYIIGLAVLGFSYWFLQKTDRQTTTFYGFAENKETEISLDHSILINKVHVKAGQSVKKGDFLLDVTRMDIDFKVNDLSHDLMKMEVDDRVRLAEIQSKIQSLLAEKTERQQVFVSKINNFKADADFNQTLLNDLKSVNGTSNTTNTTDSPQDIRLKAIQTEMQLAMESYDARIAQLENTRQLVAKPTQVGISRTKNEMALLEKSKERLHIIAPNDGIIGNLHCVEGENKSSFEVLISFYEKNPNRVVSYIQENLLLKVQLGDTLQIKSYSRPKEKSNGIVVGQGFRLIEIPERLRKFPEIKTYGREIMVEIPGNNTFLQNEKVVLFTGKGGDSTLVSFLPH